MLDISRGAPFPPFDEEPTMYAIGVQKISV